MSDTTSKPAQMTRAGFVYEPAIGPGLKKLLYVLFFGFALLGATGAYLVAIRAFEWWNAPQVYTNAFSLWIFIIHIGFGILLLIPFLYFGIKHWSTAKDRMNRRAVKLGIGVFLTGVAICVTGLALVQLDERFQLPTGLVRDIIRWAHVATPILAVFLYVLHRRAGPAIQWKWGYFWGGSVGAFILVMVFFHYQDPHKWFLAAPKEGDKYFHPSKARTAGGKFVSAETFMMDEYCMKCHQDIYNDHLHSAHKRSSFNNPPYLFSVAETIKVTGRQASRWCAGCHDPVPFLSGQFDDENYFKNLDNPDQFLKDNPTAHAGISCTVCHAMTHVNSATGDADYVIDEPEHYPFATSDNKLLQWINNQTIKAKPDFHKKTFLKPFHKSEQFCSTCHKVSLPIELNKYKEFLRGQNHYDAHLLSGFSSTARSFYYPKKAQSCNDCHMPLKESNDFGAKDFDGSGTRKVHDHFFPGANTGLAWLLSQKTDDIGKAEGLQKAALKNADFLRGTDGTGKKLRIDLFGVKEGGTIDGKLHVIRPKLPSLEPGKRYLIEVVIRTLGVGHIFTQGTADSNEIWVESKASYFDPRKPNAPERPISANGLMQGEGEEVPMPKRPYVTLDNREVDKHSHFVNVFMLDRHGNRINRRNAQDIFTPLYNHQMPPGTGQVVHYALEVPADAKLPIKLNVRLRYRKFDYEYMKLVHKGKVPLLPVVDLCEDEVILPVQGSGLNVAEQKSTIEPYWQRWNDYGIGCYLEGGVGKKAGELRQAEEAFRWVIENSDGKGPGLGYLNLARIHFDEGRYDEAIETLDKASSKDLPEPAPWWTVAWLTAKVNVQNGNVEQAISNYRKILDPKLQPVEQGFDFTRDYVIINELANAYFTIADRYEDPKERDPWLKRAIGRFERTLELDQENVDAHYRLSQCYRLLGASLSEKAIGDVPELPAKIEEMNALFSEKANQFTGQPDLARTLGEMVTKLGERDYALQVSKLPVLRMLLEKCQGLLKDANAETKTATYYLLGHVHRELHSIYKPDFLAAGRAVRAFRQKQTPESKAADHASQAIVIYEMNGK